ncbi:MAG TPA: nucleoside triphosphate pyrophosphohydrolase [Syntrophorhabdaceae bacterium]|nr:nucleoside triphosphate pyrophosphohydrolase [Syntrophorhabdaceae bacterium]
MEEFSKLVGLMERLRSDAGCQWDRKQTVHSFKTFLLEEVYEAIEAIEKNDAKLLQEELGDLLFHIVFIAEICKEGGLFNIADVIRQVYEKMYNRHPHVFQGKPMVESIEEKWEELKKQEKAEYAPLSGIPRAMPALLRAYVITKRAAKVGFDWKEIQDVYEKLFEEVGELRKAQETGDPSSIREEIGDLLFTVVNIARFLDVDPEDALRFTIEKFIRRFSYIEKNTDIANASLEAMDRMWNDVKDMEKKGG